jgi:Fe-S cluster assembly protein SufD
VKLAAYAEQFEQLEATLPPSERASRRVQFDCFAQQGFPDKSTERWHYTDLSALNDRSFVTAVGPAAAVAMPELGEVDRLVFTNGRVDPEHSSAPLLAAVAMPPAPADDDALSALNAAFANPGLDLNIAARQQLPRPIHVLIEGSGVVPSMTHQRHRIRLGEQAEASVFIELIGNGEGERLATQRLDIELAARARLTLVRIQREQSGTTLIANTVIRVDRDAQLHTVLVDTGTGLARHEIEITLAAPGAEAAVHALCMPSAKSHTDTQAHLIHAAPQGRSRLNFRGIIGERARAVFNGHVLVRPGAQKTDSEQRIASLLLSPRAEIDAKPDLEIYADDVKCAHGATVGQLDETALAYLRSRGIAADAARALLLRAFAIEAIEPIAYLPLRQHVESLLGFPRDDIAAVLDDLLGDQQEEAA